MNETKEQLIQLLVAKNKNLTYGQARKWIEFLWEDFEATAAKAGNYHGSYVTERIVKQWVENYGDKLHQFQSLNPKYAHLFQNDDIVN
ncbi:MAG: YfhJ family protein [Bacillaceae bacterium]